LVRGPGRAAGSPLVRTVIVVDDDAAGSGLELPGVAAERLHVPPGTAKFDLLVTFRAEGGGYQGFLDYAGDRYGERTAAHVAESLCALLDTATSDPGCPLARLGPAVTAGLRTVPD